MKPRIRTVKPEIAYDEKLWDLGEETGLPVFQAFVVLWCHADREGRFEWRPRSLGTKCLPFWKGDFSRVLDALASRGFLVKYAISESEFGWIRRFEKHQHINNKEPLSDLPSPPESVIETECSRDVDASSTRDAHVVDVPIPSLPVPSVNKGGSGGKSKSKPKRLPEVSIPGDWAPNQSHRDRSTEYGLDLNWQVQKFKLNAEEKEIRSRNWNARFTRWLMNAAEWGQTGRKGTSPGLSEQDQTLVDHTTEALRNGKYGDKGREFVRTASPQQVLAWIRKRREQRQETANENPN